jgi:hypothetical protein
MATKVTPLVAPKCGRLVTKEKIARLVWKLELIDMAIRSLKEDDEGTRAIVLALQTVTEELQEGMNATDCGPLAVQIEMIKLAVYGLAGEFSAPIEDGLDDVKAELNRLAAA